MDLWVEEFRFRCDLMNLYSYKYIGVSSFGWANDGTGWRMNIHRLD